MMPSDPSEVNPGRSAPAFLAQVDQQTPRPGVIRILLEPLLEQGEGLFLSIGVRTNESQTLERAGCY
jgi:hypothetical protein